MLNLHAPVLAPSSSECSVISAGIAFDPGKCDEFCLYIYRAVMTVLVASR